MMAFLAFAFSNLWLFMGGFRAFLHPLGIEYFRPSPAWQGLGLSRLLAAMVPSVIIGILYTVIVATLVYRDAQRRGMDPWMWATIATFVPFFIGIVIYLVVRSNGRATCEKCGRPIRSDYRICPYCGHRREAVCPQCGRAVAREWKVCPYCEIKLAPEAGP